MAIPLQLNLLFLEWRGWTPSPPNMKASRRIWEVQAAAPREHHVSGPGLQGVVKDLRRAVVGSPPPDTAHDETPRPGTCQHWRCAAFGSSEVFGERSCPPSSSHPACSRGWPHIPSPPFHLPAQQLSRLCQFFWLPWDRGRADLAGFYYAGNLPVAYLPGSIARRIQAGPVHRPGGKEKWLQTPWTPVQVARGDRTQGCRSRFCFSPLVACFPHQPVMSTTR